MPEETIAIDYVMEAASGAHFSGLRLESPSYSAAAAASSPSAAATASTAASAFADSNAPKQPFVIGTNSTNKKKLSHLIEILAEISFVYIITCEIEQVFREVRPRGRPLSAI